MKDLETIIDEVGGQGLYQQRLLYFVLSPLFFLLPLSWMTEVFYLYVPNHWCYHPMTDHLNQTALNAWKKCFLNENVDGSFDGCKIPLPNISNIEKVWGISFPLDIIMDEKCPERKWESLGIQSYDIINSTCDKGWTFDKSEFTRTIPTDQKWVCDDSHDYVADLYTYGQAGGIIGGVVFSYIADRFGRRLTFWITTAMICVFMTAKTFLVDQYTLYVILKVVANACYVSTYQLPATLITEVADPTYRSWAILIAWIMWVLGLCLLPLLGWLIGDWFILSLVTSPLMLISFLGWKFVPESPRWLLSRPNRVEESASIFRQIAKTNKKTEPENLNDRLKKISDEILEEQHLGYISLFNHSGLAIKTFLITVASFCANYTYNQLYLNLDNLGGNFFINFFLLSFIEGPATYIAKLLADRFGRRWSHTLTLLFNAIVFAIIVSIANHHENDLTSQWTVSILCMIAKFNCTMSFYFFYLQSIELFPTCVRNTGIGFVSFVAAMFGLAGPHITALGSKDKRIPLGVMGLINLLASITASFLPETLECDLPETLKSASNFGRDQAFFSYVTNGKVKIGNNKKKNHIDS